MRRTTTIGGLVAAGAIACVLLLAAGLPALGRSLAAQFSTPTPTSTVVPSPTPTDTPTATPRPSSTPSPTAAPSPTPTALPTPTPRPTASPAGSGYWHTAGGWVVDSAGRHVRIASVNWFGMENVYYVPAGLDRQPLDVIMTRVHDLGFNAIRLPFSNQLVESNPIVTKHLDANPDLQGLHALDILDRIVAAAGRRNLRIILNNGRSNIGTPPQEDGLWYTPYFSERSWIRDWVTLAQRYRGNPTVVGLDLRNEPHTAPPGPWSLAAYLKQGATWGPYRGVDNPATDWRLAAERAGNAVLKVNPHLLIVVEGIQMYPDPAQPRGVDTYWWGGVLQAAAQYPVRLSVPHQLVYSPHEYGPYKYPMRFFGPTMSYAGLTSVWNKHWGYLVNPGYRGRTPIFLGEFGTCGYASCVSSAVPGSTGAWFRYLMQYLKANPQIGWSFWALNGTNQRGADMKNYILKSDWQTVRLPPLIDALHAIEQPTSGGR